MPNTDDRRLRGKYKCVCEIVCTIINGIMSIHFQHDTTNSCFIKISKDGMKISQKVLGRQILEFQVKIE